MLTRYLLLMLMTCEISMATAQIGAKAHQQNTLVGAWSSNQFGFEMILMFNADNTGEFDGLSLTYSINGNSLLIKSEGVTTSYQYEVQADQLTLSGGDLDSKAIFIRLGQNKDTHPGMATDNKTSAGQMDSPSILGSWSGGGEVLEFRSDGQCMISGQPVAYQYNPPWIELNGPGGSIKIETSFTDQDHMNLKVNGNLVPYTRSGATANVGQGNANSVSSGGQIDGSMVGKWCYTNVNSYNEGSSYSSTCITLNADGTYVYVSESERDVNTSSFWAGTNSQGNDAGKWWVQGDRIYYNSPTKGQGSYHFEKRNHPKNVNDPMLVIEGTSYVTAYQKAPW